MELKPCPFCGGAAAAEIVSTEKHNEEIGWKFQIKCPGCGARISRYFALTARMRGNGEVLIMQDERKKAEEIWNTRTE